MDGAFVLPFYDRHTLKRGEFYLSRNLSINVKKFKQPKGNGKTVNSRSEYADAYGEISESEDKRVCIPRDLDITFTDEDDDISTLFLYNKRLEI